jgi:hypothetical protein
VPKRSSMLDTESITTSHASLSFTTSRKAGQHTHTHTHTIWLEQRRTVLLGLAHRGGDAV